MPRAVLCLTCNELERMTDPPKESPLVPAVMKWMDNGVEREYTIKDPETGMNAMVPMHDPLLEDFTGRHSHDLPDTEVIARIKVWQVDQETWDSMDVLSQIKKEMQENQNIIVEESNYYQEEATKCYNRHNNPDLKNGCPDFMTPHMRIGSGKVHPKAQVFLCHMCPYMQTYVAQEMRDRAGAYEGKVKGTSVLPPKAKRKKQKR